MITAHVEDRRLEDRAAVLEDRAAVLDNVLV